MAFQLSARTWIIIIACLMIPSFLVVIRQGGSGPPDEAALRRAEIWLRDVRDLSSNHPQWDFIRWYSYSKIGSAYVVFEGGVEKERDLEAFQRAVEQASPPVPLVWNVRVITNGWNRRL